MGTAIIGKFGVQERLDAKEHVRSERKRPFFTYIDVRRSFDARRSQNNFSTKACCPHDTPQTDTTGKALKISSGLSFSGELAKREADFRCPKANVAQGGALERDHLRWRLGKPISAAAGRVWRLVARSSCISSIYIILYRIMIDCERMPR